MARFNHPFTPGPWLLVLFLQVPAMRAFFKYLPYPYLTTICLVLLAVAGYHILLDREAWPAWLRRLLSSPLLTVTVIVALATAIYFVYPYADALKEQGRGSTADDALIVTFNGWWESGTLYDDAHIYGGAKASPGPGWILLNAPFVMNHGALYFLLVPFWLVVACVIFRAVGASLLHINQILLALSSSLATWELGVIGHDALALSCCVAALYLTADAGFENNRKLLFYGGSVALGVFATSRIIFPFIAPLMGLLWWWLDWRRALLFVVISTVTLALLHGYHLLQNSYYDPFHLWDRAESNIGMSAIALGFAVTLAAGILAGCRPRYTQSTRMKWFILCFSSPLVFISFGELQTVNFDIARWEGSNFLLPIAMTVLYWVVVERDGKDALPDKFRRERSVQQQRDTLARSTSSPVWPP